MAELEFRNAIRDALDEELARDASVVLFGEDVAKPGGVFAVTGGLQERHGRERVFDTPISELAIAGAAFGAAISGLRPVIEIMFGDFLFLAMDSLANQAAKYFFISNEQSSVPLVVRSAVGAGGRFGAIHSQMPVPWFQGIPGLPPSLLDPPPGCPFNQRCPHVMERCRVDRPVLQQVQPDRWVACHLFDGPGAP